MLKKYFEAESESLASLSKQASSTGHPTDTGSNREDILIDFLNKHLPSKFKAIKGGKIFDSDGALTKQTDVIIYDNEVPRLASQENTLYLAEGVSSAIEVKSALNSNTLSDSLENLKSIKKINKKMNISISVGDFRKDIYCGIFAYNTELNVDKILDKLESFSKDNNDTDFADFILVNNKFLFLKNNGTWTMTFPDGKTEEIKEKYLTFEDSMILYKLFILLCRDISSFFSPH